MLNHPARAHVLLVDDEESMRVTALALLEDRFDVEAVRSGEEALVWLRRHEVDVVCADFRMPGMNGLELLAEVMQRYAHVSGVLVTGHRDFLGARVVDRLSYSVLLKPYAAEELVERVERAVQLTEIKRSLAQQGAGRPGEAAHRFSSHRDAGPLALPSLPKRRP